MRIAACALPDGGDQHWAEDTGEAPCRQHQPIDRANVFCAEIVCGKRRHGAETTSVAEQDGKADRSESRESSDARERKEQDRLDNEHRQKDPATSNEVREPCP